MLALGVALAVFVGISLGLLGGGGSILMVPILLYVLRRPAHEAIAMSLLVVGTTSVAALVPHALAGRVRWKTGASFGAASMVAAHLAGRAAAGIPARFLVVAFGVLMLVTAVAMMRGRRAPAGACAAPLALGGATSPAELPLGTLALLGVAVGVVTGLLGAGGGFLVVPALLLFGRLPMTAAVGTSLLVIAMNSFAALAGHLARGSVDGALAATVTTAAVLGSLVGSALVARVPQAALRKGFGWFVVVMAVFILGQELPRLVGLDVRLVAHWPYLFTAMAVPPAVAGLVRLARRPDRARASVATT